jgi:hypothetical protein
LEFHPHPLTAATFAANMRLKHGTYIRNTYEFTLPYVYSYLEPMDLVTLNTTSVWAQGINNINLGVVNLPVRITKIVDDPTEGLKIEAEDYPFGAGCPLCLPRVSRFPRLCPTLLLLLEIQK